MTLPQPWRLAFPLVVLTVLGLLAVFFDTARSMVAIWNHDGTFTHGYIIAPISLWMIWQQRAVLAHINPHPSWWGVFALLGSVFLWLLGDVSGAQVVSQYAMVATIPAAALALLGWPVVRLILIPLLFLLLAVPFGDAFIDPLMNQTADFTVAALQITGIPVFREGNTITIPTGVWSVVQACSGVRYLIASVTLGIIYAYLTYRSIWRRLAFVLAATIVPIFANGARAYMIVMIGHLSDMKLAVGVDHLIYGWLFFGLVMLVLFWVGSFWREDNQPHVVVQHEQSPAPPASFWHLLTFTAIVFAIAGAGSAYSALVTHTMANQPQVVLSEPDIAGWERTDAFTSLHPQFKNPAAEQMRFLLQNGERAGVYIGYYRNQSQHAELISYGNVLAMPGGGVREDDWRRLNESILAIQAENLGVRQNILAKDSQRMLGWSWYWVGDRFTTSSYVAKGYLALNRLLLRRDDSAVVAVFAPYTENQDTATATLQRLVHDALPVVQQQLQQARQH
jgi:exosortase A